MPIPLRRLDSLLTFVLASAMAALAAEAKAGILEDRGIEDAIASSFVFQHVLTDRSMVQLYVRGGAVELRGQTADETERALLGYTIAAIPHVVSVDNNLFVDSAGKRDSRRWRALRIRTELMAQADLDLRATRIAYSGQRWEIAGSVPSEAQRELATARIAALAISEPLHVNLQVAAPAPEAPMDDASVIGLVRSALDRLAAPRAESLNVSCVGGVVLIRGPLASKSELPEFTRLAAAIRGVKSVEYHPTGH